MDSQKNLSLAYSPGVAEPCIEIHKNPELVYKYINKGNIVAVISNGTAVLRLGNLGALGAKPVMEGKSVLFKNLQMQTLLIFVLMHLIKMILLIA